MIQFSNKKLYSPHIGLALLRKYTSMEHWREFTRVNPDPLDTIMCNATCIVDNSRYPTELSANYCLTRFTCILFLLLEYMFFYRPSCVPASFASITTITQTDIREKNSINKLKTKNIRTTWKSSSSSYRAGSTDIPDPLSPLLPIVHRPR